ncbi:MAG: DMT family transporter [Candidatus Pacearchaeota archaeon]|jgi:drug/metabolite transporter (DMT)-like permease
MWIPIISAIALAAGTVAERFLLKKKKVNIKHFQTFSFLSISIILLPLVFFFWNAKPEAFQLKNILLMLAIVVISFFANILTFYSLKKETLTKLEPIRITEPLFVILFSIIFSLIGLTIFETKTSILIPALIAGVALVFAHIKKHHLQFSSASLAALFGSLLFALELVLSRLVLDYYSAITFYFVRCILIGILTFIVFRPKLFQKGNSGLNLKIFLIAIIWIVYRIILYYGYLEIGVVSTTLMLMLGPILIYFSSVIFLKEKLNWKSIILSLIILGCVLYASLI